MLGINCYLYGANPTGADRSVGVNLKTGGLFKVEKKDASGMAIVRQYENGFREGHFIVEIHSNQGD